MSKWCLQLEGVQDIYSFQMGMKPQILSLRIHLDPEPITHLAYRCADPGGPDPPQKLLRRYGYGQSCMGSSIREAAFWQGLGGGRESPNFRSIHIPQILSWVTHLLKPAPHLFLECPICSSVLTASLQSVDTTEELSDYTKVQCEIIEYMSTKWFYSH